MGDMRNYCENPMQAQIESETQCEACAYILKGQIVRRDATTALWVVRCPECGTVILCTKASDNDPNCCDKDMEIQQPKKNPSSD